MLPKKPHTYTPPTDLMEQLTDMQFLLQDCTEWLAILQNEYVNNYRKSAMMKLTELEARSAKLRRQLKELVPIEYRKRTNYPNPK